MATKRVEALAGHISPGLSNSSVVTTLPTPDIRQLDQKFDEAWLANMRAEVDMRKQLNMMDPSAEMVR